MFIGRYALVNGEEINLSPYIYRAIELGTISYKEIISESGKRLDHYSYEEYNDPRNWWIIAAASGIGWWLQVTPGTVLRIPTDLTQIEQLKEAL